MVLLGSIVIGFIVAAVSAAVTTLQRPGGWLLCSSGRFVEGNEVEHSVGATGYNFNAACVTDDGPTRKVSSIRLLGVLWFEYTVVVLAILVALVVVVGAIRRARAS